MRNRIPGGLLVVVEGIDGAGKTSVATHLTQWCGERGFACASSKEPTGLGSGQILRESAKTGRLSVQEEVDLFLKDRLEHVERSIRPALEGDSIVILDRYYWSTAAYQGSRGVDYEKIVADNEALVPIPDLILLLDVDVKTGIDRICSRGDTPNDFENTESLQKARDIFLALHDGSAVKSVKIEASADLRSVFGQALIQFKIAMANKIASGGLSKEALNSMLLMVDGTPVA